MTAMTWIGIVIGVLFCIAGLRMRNDPQKQNFGNAFFAAGVGMLIKDIGEATLHTSEARLAAQVPYVLAFVWLIIAGIRMNLNTSRQL